MDAPAAPGGPADEAPARARWYLRGFWLEGTLVLVLVVLLALGVVDGWLFALGVGTGAVPRLLELHRDRPGATHRRAAGRTPARRRAVR